MNRVLVTGGTGFIGLELVRQLCAAGLTPRVLVRRPHRAALLAPLDVELIQGDLDSTTSLERAVRGVDTVFHLGGRASFETYARLKPSIVDGSRRLGAAAADAGVEHFVFASSLFVYDSSSQPVDDATPANPRMAYGRAKLAAEALLGDIAAGSGMGLANVRFPHVYGPQSILFQQVRRGVAIFPGQMANRCGQLHVADAASLLVAIGANRWTGTSAVADDRIVTWREYFDIVNMFYPGYRLVTLPPWIGIVGASVLEPVLSGRSRPTLYTRDTVVGFNLDLPVKPGLLWEALGIKPALPTVLEGIPAALDGYVKFRWRHPLLDRRKA